MERLIVLDTETTGLDNKKHRIIEIGAVIIENRKITGVHFHKYINPQCQIDPSAQKVHGISIEFLKDKPLFEEIVKEFIELISGSTLVIHNAPFDIGFLDMELTRLGYEKITAYVKNVIDTLPLARQKDKKKKNTLDALLDRYNIDRSERSVHGALLDARLLSHLYLAMTKKQETFSFDFEILEDKYNYSIEEFDKNNREIDASWTETEN